MSNQLHRKPVSFNQYYFLLVKMGGIWCYDCGSWNYTEILIAERAELKATPRDRVKLCTSPSDDERVIARIIKEYNRYT